MSSLPQEPSTAPASTLAPEEQRALTSRLAAALGETKPGPIAQLDRVISLLGPDQAERLVAEAQALQAGPGMRTKDGSRQRTLGGIFFYLAYGRATPAQKRLLRPALLRQPKRPRRHVDGVGAVQSAPNPTPPMPPLDMPLEELAREAAAWEAGIANRALTKLIGRPLKLQQAADGQHVAFTLPPDPLPALPKGLPPISVATRYLVLVAASQWEAVEPALQRDPEERLLIEGYSVRHPQFEGIAVLAFNCRSLAQVAAKRA